MIIDDFEDGKISIYPEWIESVSMIVEEFRFDEIIPHQFFYDFFRIYPREENIDLHERDKRTFAFISSMGMLKQSLLKDYHRDLQNVRSKGYRMVHPSQQAELAYGDAVSKIENALGQGVLRASMTEVSALSESERRSHFENVTRIRRIADAYAREQKRLEDRSNILIG